MSHESVTFTSYIFIVCLEMQFVLGVSIGEYHVYCFVQCLRECRFAYA